MAKKVVLLLILNLVFYNLVFAEEKVNLEDKIIGSAFKTLAKAFVAIADINKLKENNLYKLNKMDEQVFRKRYAEVYKVIKDLPDKLKISFAITAEMTKAEVVKKVRIVDKKKAYEIIDSIPDAIIARQFKQYLSENKQRMRESNITRQINKLWNKIITKALSA